MCQYLRNVHNIIWYKRTKRRISQSFSSILYEKFNGTYAYIYLCAFCWWAGKVRMYIHLFMQQQKAHCLLKTSNMKLKTIQFKMQYKYRILYSIYFDHIVCSVTYYLSFCDDGLTLAARHTHTYYNCSEQDKIKSIKQYFTNATDRQEQEH